MIQNTKKLLILFKKKIIFSDLKKNNLVVFDCTSKNYIEDLFPSTPYYLLSNRIERVEKIFLNLSIIKFIFTNFFKRKLKQNYIIALIKQLKPKIVITLIDNSVEFSFIANYFKNKIPFYAIQGANRGDVKLSSDEEVNFISFDTLFCIGHADKNLYLKKKIKVKNFIVSGPLRPSLALKYIDKERIKIDSNKFDIFLPTELSINSPYNKFTNYSDSCLKLADYVLDICSKHKLKLVFSAESYLNSETFIKEQEFYKIILQKYNLDLYAKTSKYSTYIRILESNLTIGLNTTVLREALYLRKKIFACNLTNFVHADFPIKNISSPEIKNFNQFENHVLKLLELKTENYFEIIKTDLNKEFNINKDCSDIINQEIKKVINNQ